MSQDKVLCTVSGGKDSVAMLLILKELGYNVALAHVNFNLRGQESDNDQKFVEQLALKLKIPFHLKSIDTRTAAFKGESIQLTARRLRYKWFANLAKEEGFDKIATAHSANDNAETIIYNLSKGTGLKGLVGIPPLNGNIIRPIMCLSTNEILEYLSNKNQDFRQDSSNASDKYARNKIRHHIVPVLHEINPAFTSTISGHSERFSKIAAFYFNAIQQAKNALWTFNKSGWYCADLENIGAETENALVEHLLPLGFSETAITDILNGSNGAHASTDNHRIVKDRNSLLLGKIELPKQANFSFDIRTNGHFETPLGNLYWEENGTYKPEDLSKPHFAFINLEQIDSRGKLTLRKVKNGDKMIPFGQKGKKLLSNLMIDKKLNQFEKEKSLVLELNGEIIWWVGHRIADNFKVNSTTKKWLRFYWKNLEGTAFKW